MGIDEGSKPAFGFTVIYEEDGEDPELQANLKSRAFGGSADEDTIMQQLLQKTCVISVDLPEVKTAQAVQLDISDECAHVATTGLKSDTLTVWFPRAFCSRLASAEWQPWDKKLVIRVPCSPFIGSATVEIPSVFNNSLADLAF